MGAVFAPARFSLVRISIPDLVAGTLVSGNKKRAQRLLFGSGDRPVGWGSSTRRSGGLKVRVLPRKFVFLGFRRGIWDVPGILPGCLGPVGVLKTFVQKRFVRIFRDHLSKEFWGWGWGWEADPTHYHKILGHCRC